MVRSNRRRTGFLLRLFVVRQFLWRTDADIVFPYLEAQNEAYVGANSADKFDNWFYDVEVVGGEVLLENILDLEDSQDEIDDEEE